jgi:predicted enzyme related to lactoylglutathione lyase
MVNLVVNAILELTMPPPNAVSSLLARHGGLTYLHIPAPNPHQSADFYHHVLGWLIDDSDSRHIKFSDPAGHLIGRFIPDLRPSREGFLPYFYVDHVDDAITRAIAHGGQLLTPPYPEGNLCVATLLDPASNHLGLWQQS